MSFLEPFVQIPETQKRRYLISRSILWIICLSIALTLLLRVIFPTLPFSFDFKSPQSRKNTFLDPRNLSDQSLITNGKIDADHTLIGNFDGPGTFSRIRVSLGLNKKSPPATAIKASLSRSYRSFFLPIDGVPIASFDHPSLYRDQDGIYYTEENNTLKRFVSSRAYLTRYPESFALPLESSLANTLPISDEWIGFRVGTLLSFADGVFLVTSDQEIRPFGDPSIFLSMGYHFKDVIPAQEEEIGIYTRGRILLYGAPQSDGTLFHDTDSGAYLMLENEKLHPVTSPEYRKFLLEEITPTDTSFSSRNITLTCLPTATWYRKNYICDIPNSALSPTFGTNFQLSLKSDSLIDIDTLKVELITDHTKNNFLLFASQIKSRLLNRFGLGQ